MPHIQTSKNVKIFYEVFGENGPWVTLVNGHTRTHSDFKGFSKFLAQSGFRALCFDNRGSGQTEYQGEFSFTDLVQDVCDLWDKLSIDSSHLLGISMGGMVSQSLAASHSNRVKSLVLVSTTPTAKWILGPAQQGWGTSESEVINKLELYFAPQFTTKNKLLIKSMAKQILKGIETGDFTSGANQQRIAMDGLDLTETIHQIRCHTLIIHGLEDNIIAPHAATELHKNIENSTLETIPNVGHLLLAEYAKQMFSMVGEFLTEN